MPFTNPLVAGTTLIRTAIHSGDYVPGVSGWTINADGSYEFGAGGTFRGDLSVQGQNGSKVVISADPGFSARVSFYPEENIAIVPTPNVDIPAYITAQTNVTNPVAPFSGIYGTLTIASPAMDWNGSAATNNTQLELDSPATDGSNPYGSATFTGIVNAGPDDTDLGLGIQAVASSVANSTASGAEVIVLTVPAFTFRKGRAYSIKMAGGVATATAGTLADFRIKKSAAGVISGTTYGELYRIGLTTTAVFGAYGEITVKNSTASDVTSDVSLTLQSATNTVTAQAGVGRQRTLTITDVGAASDTAFTNATVVT